MFEEFLADLESRFRRAIPLPDESFYIAVEQKIVEQLAADLEKEQHANSTITSSTDNLVPIGKSIFERPQLNSWWSPVPLDQPFSEWSELARMNLSRVFERLDFCIRFGEFQRVNARNLQDVSKVFELWLIYVPVDGNV